MPTVLIIDDDEILCRTITRQLCMLGYQVNIAQSIQEAIHQLVETHFDVILLDVCLPDGSGLDMITKVQNMPQAPDIIVITGYPEHEDVRLAIDRGVWDYIQKPWRMDDLKSMLEGVMAYRLRRKKENLPDVNSPDIIGNNPALKQALTTAIQVAASDINVLITGETGTGKELFARAIHENSTRKAADMVVVDCSILPDNLVESTLFGHTRGAFTGAMTNRTGLVQQAHQGTLFLDEIGELPLATQKSFLRLLEQRCYRPIGAKSEIQVDFRLVVATNRNLGEMVKTGAFREDLLHRINSLVIDIPPLRQRLEDIPLLTQHIIHKLCRRSGKAMKKPATDLLQLLQEYDWPGNVRELVNVLDRLIITSGSQETLLPIHLPPEMRTRVIQNRLSVSPFAAADYSVRFQPQGLPETAVFEFPKIHAVRQNALQTVEQEYLTALMQHVDGNVQKAARVAGLAKSQLYNLLNKYDLREVRDGR